MNRIGKRTTVVLREPSLGPVFGIKGGATVSLTVFAIGVIATIPALFIMRVREKTSPETFLWNIRIGYVASLGIQAVIAYVVLVVFAEMHIKYFWITFVGSLTALLLNVYSAAYVAESHKTARGLIAAAASSVSTVIHRGIAAGMRGAAIPALIVAVMMGLVYLMGVVDEKGEDRFTYGLFALALMKWVKTLCKYPRILARAIRARV